MCNTDSMATTIERDALLKFANEQAGVAEVMRVYRESASRVVSPPARTIAARSTASTTANVASKSR